MAVTVVVFLGWFAWQFWSGQSSAPRETYLVANRDLLPGETLSLHDITGESGTVEPSAKGFLNDQDLAVVIGATVRQPVRTGQRLTAGIVQKRNKRPKIPFGMRAYQVLATDSPPVAAGDRVDVWAASNQAHFDSGGPLVEGALVLSGLEMQENLASGVVLALRPWEIALLEKALRRSTLKLVVRGANDSVVQRRRSVRRKRPSERPIPVVSGIPAHD